MTFKQALDQYTQFRRQEISENSIKSYLVNLRYLILAYEWMAELQGKDSDISNITTEEIEAYLRVSQRLEFWDINHIYHWKISFKKFFDYTNAKGWTYITFALIPRIRMFKKYPKVATTEDIQALMQAIEKNSNTKNRIRDRSIMRMYVETGLRRDELLRITLSDLLPGSAGAIVRNGKAQYDLPWDRVHWSHQMTRELQEWLELRDRLHLDHDYLFCSLGSTKFGKPMGSNGINKMFNRYSDLAGVHITPHMIRHWKGRSITRQNGSVYDVMNILRHKDMRSSRVYTMEAGQARRDLFEKYHVDI